MPTKEGPVGFVKGKLIFNFVWLLILNTLGMTARAQEGQGPAVQAERSDLDMDAAFLGAMPRDRRGSVVGFLTLNTPGGLTAEGDPASPSTRSTRIVVDGFRLDREWLPVLALATARVSRWGYGAEQADAPSGLVSLRTRPPGEGTHAEVEGSAEWRRDRGEEPGLTRQIVMPQVSAPLVRDRLFVMVASQLERERSDGAVDPTGFFARATGLRRNSMQTALKLTWLATATGRLSLLALASQGSRGPFGGLNVAREAYLVSQHQAWFAGLTWNQGLTERWRWEVGGAWSWSRDLKKPASCRLDPDICQNVPPMVGPGGDFHFGNGEAFTSNASDRFSGHATLTWDAPVLGPIAQRLVFGLRGELESRNSATRTPGHEKIFWSGISMSRRQEVFANDPRLEMARVGWWSGHASQSTALAFLEDRINLGSAVTVTPGLAVFAAQGASTYAHLGDMLILPQVSAAWDLTRDGKTFVRASAHRRADADLISFAEHSLGTPVTRECVWNANTQSYDGGCRFGGGPAGSTVGLPCGKKGVDAQGAPCLEKVRMPRTWEIAGAVERVLPLNVVLGVDVVHRRTTGRMSRVQTDAAWNTGGSELDRLRPPLPGYDVTNLNSGNTLSWHETRMTPYLERRAGPRLRFRLAYSRANLSYPGLVSPNPLLEWKPLTDNRSSIHALIVIEPHRFVSLGIVYRYLQGETLRIAFQNIQNSTRDDLRGSATLGRAFHDPQDNRPGRKPDAQSLALQLRGKIPAFRLHIEPFLDIFGILAPPSILSDDSSLRFSRPDEVEHRYGFRLGLAGRI